MNKTDRIEKLAAIFLALTNFALVALPVGMAYAIFGQGLGREALVSAFPQVTVPDPLSRATVFAILAVGLFVVLAVIYTLWNMRLLFRRYANGEMLSYGCATAILRIGKGLVSVALIPILAHPVQVLLISLENPPGQRAFAIAISSDNVGFLLAGGLVILLGWVLREAVSIAEENQRFV